MINSQIQNYKITSPLGEGGMAKVYLAHYSKFDTNVAIKLLNKEYTLNENIRKRFLAEAKNMFRMSHPNIIKVTDLIDDGEIVAFVMEYVEGETLKEYIERKGKLSDEEIKSIFLQMLDALGYVHEQNLVHRDIKPSNFMVTPSCIVKLMDFGIAKNTDTNSAEYTQTGTGVQMGTPMYMSPEQITETKNVSPQSDIYSLGVVLWQMVTGKKPYDMKSLSTFQLQTKIVNESLPKTNSSWDSVIEKATVKEISIRFKSCRIIKNYLNLDSNQENSIEKTKLNLDNTIIDSVTTELDKIIECPRCLGKGYVDWNDIYRLERHNYWIPGECDLCESEGVINENKMCQIDDVSLTSDNLSFINNEINSKKYDTIKVGDQIWMTENLNVDHFRNGDTIKEAKTNDAWIKAGQARQAAWCYYEDNDENGKKFGKLYNWYAVNDPRVLAPEGWHIPSDKEWSILIDFLGGKIHAGEKMKTEEDWLNVGVETNESRLNALPSGYRDDVGCYYNIDKNCYWWSSLELTSNRAWIRYLNNETSVAYRKTSSKVNGFSVRCLKD